MYVRTFGIVGYLVLFSCYGHRVAFSHINVCETFLRSYAEFSKVIMGNMVDLRGVDFGVKDRVICNYVPLARSFYTACHSLSILAPSNFL